MTNLKNIVQIQSSLGHFLALKKAYRKSIYDWDAKTLEIWMGRNGFDFCMGVIKYGRITGSILANASFEFMRDTLGITDENLASKLKGELEKVRKECMQDCALFGWGTNKHGQLATKSLFASNPIKITLPDHITLDETKKDLNSIKT